MVDERPRVGVVHLDGNEAQARTRARHLRDRSFEDLVEPLHVANLQLSAGGVAGSDQLVDVPDGITKRLFAEDVETGGESQKDLLLVQRIGRADDNCIKLDLEKLLERLRGRDAVGGNDEIAGCG